LRKVKHASLRGGSGNLNRPAEWISRTAQIFVAVLGASSYTYAEATFTQALPDWIGSHARAFAFFGGAARQTVSDNLRSGVTRACFHEPLVNRTYADLARH
jgi:transposase